MAQYSPIYYAIQRCIQDKHRHKQMMQTTLYIIADGNVLFDIEKEDAKYHYSKVLQELFSSPLHNFMYNYDNDYDLNKHKILMKPNLEILEEDNWWLDLNDLNIFNLTDLEEHLYDFFFVEIMTKMYYMQEKYSKDIQVKKLQELIKNYYTDSYYNINYYYYSNKVNIYINKIALLLNIELGSYPSQEQMDEWTPKLTD